ncbi:hypothetical protein GPEL0_01r4199 [Geoanaerobacter pelophilus]|uniref:Uncharacterized protein n=2 Tax=Geoanaerobacter pelophilus TaxID=60036 RepID=A0ABQ0MLT2_9BACT|nr:hypothetical protein GPEL0_01r4199 [Geoanaerobacter pelophilus]
MIILYPVMVLVAIRGEKRMVKDGYIKASFPWPEVHGDKVPIVARKYKIIVIGFSSVALFFTLCCVISLFC